MIADTGGPASPGSSERGLMVMSSQLHEHLQRQHSATNCLCLPHGELRVPKGKDPLPRAKKLSRDDPARQRRSELQAARGLRRCAAQKRRTTAFVLSLRDYLGERSHLGSFRSLACDEVVRAPTDPDPLDLDCGLSFRQGHCPPRPTLNVAPAGRKPGESGQVIQEEAPGSRRRGLREVVPETRLPCIRESA